MMVEEEIVKVLKWKKAKKKKEEFAKSMKVMKAKQQDGIRKALEDYLAAQTQTMTVEDSERVVEMPSKSQSQTALSSKTSESLQKASISGTTTYSAASTPVPRNLGQMPMEKL
ncbi:hypothetical protein OSTOST_20612 [Ostertagia ostertagi]